MRKLLAFTLACAAHAQMMKTIVAGVTVAPGSSPVTLVQSKAPATNNFCGGGSTCVLSSLSSGATAGNTIVACFRWALTSGTGINLTSVTDDGSNTYTVVAGTKKTAAGGTQNEIGVQCAWASGVSGGTTTVTGHFSGGTNQNDGTTWEVTPASAVDQSAVATGTMSAGSNPPTAGSVTTVSNGEFAVVMTTIDDSFGGGGVFVAGTGYTLVQNNGGGALDSASEHKAQTSAGAITLDFTCPGNNGVWVIGGMTLKP